MSNLGPKIAGIAGVVAVLAGGCAAAYAFSDTVKNQVKLAFSKPEDYFEWVYEKNTTELAEICGGSYQQSLDRKNDGTSGWAELRLEPTQEVRDYLIDNLFGYGDPDDTEQQLQDIIRSTDSVAFKADSILRSNAASAHLTFLLNDKEITSNDMAIDLNGMQLFSRTPELSERWITMDLGEAAGEYLTGERWSVSAGDLPAAQEITDTVKKYGMLLVQDVNTVTVDKKQPVQISGISVEYTAMTAELTVDQLLNTVQSLVDTASTDTTLQKLIPDDQSFRSAMLDAGDQIRQLRSLGAGSSGTVKLTTYVDATGTIRGCFITMGSELAYFSAIGMADDRIAGEMKLSVAGKKLLGGKLDATRSGNTLSGAANLTVASGYSGDETLSLSFSDVEIVDLEKGYYSGSFTLTVPDADIAPITLTLSSDGSSQSIAYALTVEDISVGTIKLTYAMDNGGEVTLPDRSGAYEIDLNSSDADLTGYVDQASARTYLETVMQRIGFSDDVAQEAGELIEYMYE